MVASQISGVVGMVKYLTATDILVDRQRVGNKWLKEVQEAMYNIMGLSQDFKWFSLDLAKSGGDKTEYWQIEWNDDETTTVYPKSYKGPEKYYMNWRMPQRRNAMTDEKRIEATRKWLKKAKKKKNKSTDLVEAIDQLEFLDEYIEDMGLVELQRKDQAETEQKQNTITFSIEAYEEIIDKLAEIRQPKVLFEEDREGFLLAVINQLRGNAADLTKYIWAEKE